MTKLKFKADDFIGFLRGFETELTEENIEYLADEIFNHANKLFDSWYRENVENAPVLYGTTVGKPKLTWSDSPWVNLHKMKVDGPEKCSTHTARLICIEKIGGKDE